ncbi:hypothetical protein [Thermoactinomyces mirandus]|nr:hypothetical protein [Thermoactinomyces mirandus]
MRTEGQMSKRAVGICADDGAKVAVNPISDLNDNDMQTTIY